MEELLIDNQLLLNTKIDKITAQLKILEPKKHTKLLCDPCANVVPDTMQERYIELENRFTTLQCQNSRLYGSGWHNVLRVTDITKFVPVSLRSYEEGFRIDEENFFIGMDTLYQLTNSAAYEMRVQRNEFIGRWSEFVIGDRYVFYAIKTLGRFIGSESLNTLTRNKTIFGDSYSYIKTDLGACAFEEVGGLCYIGEYIKIQSQRAKHFLLQIRRNSAKLYD